MKRDYWLVWLSAVNWVAILLVLPRLPERIPIHWNIGGEIDQWGSRFQLVWIGALPFAMWALVTFLATLEAKRKNDPGFPFRVLRALRVLPVLLLIAINWIIVAAAVDESLDAAGFIQILMGIQLIVLGSVLVRVPFNGFAGIRTRWTLSDPMIWNKTHRLGGLALIFGGILFVAAALFLRGPSRFILPIVVLFTGAAVSVAYSALLWHRYHGKPKP